MRLIQPLGEWPEEKTQLTPAERMQHQIAANKRWLKKKGITQAEYLRQWRLRRKEACEKRTV